MATITIDDGTFEVGNSFATVAECTKYHIDRNNTEWVGTEAELTGAMIRAFDYLSVQPWKDYVFEEEIPIKVIYAQFHCALKELITPNALQKDITKKDLVKRKQLDVFETEYFEGATETIYTAILNFLKDYLRAQVQTQLNKQVRTLVRG